MPTINAKPFINTLLESLSDSELTTLRTLINGGGDPAIDRSILLGATNPLTDADKGIKRVRLELDRYAAQGIYDGYLIYTDTDCVLIAYAGVQMPTLTMIKLETEGDSWKYTIINEELTILGLRSELDDTAEAPRELPNPANATAGDVLTLDENKVPGWAAAGGGSGGGTQLYLHKGTLNNSGATAYEIITTKVESLVDAKFCDEFNLSSTIKARCAYRGTLYPVLCAFTSGPNDVIIGANITELVNIGTDSAVGSQCKIATDTVTEL